MANESTVVELSEENGYALDVSFEGGPLSRVVVTVLDCAELVTVFVRADNEAAEIDGDDCAVVAGGIGAFNDEIRAVRDAESVSVKSTAACKIQIARKQ